MLNHEVLPDLITLRFDLALPNLRTALLWLTSNAYGNGRSDFIALGFFTITYWMGDIVLLSANHSGVETIYASITALYCCLLSKFSAVLYNLLIFSRHMCSYISLLHNYLSTPIMAVCCFTHPGCKKPLIMKHWC